MNNILSLVSSALNDLTNKHILRKHFSNVYLNEGIDFIDYYVDRNYLKNIIHFKIKEVRDQRYPEDFIIRLFYTDNETNIIPKKPISIYCKLEDIQNDLQHIQHIRNRGRRYIITLDMLRWLGELVRSVSDYIDYTTELRSRGDIDGNTKLFVDLKNLKLIKIESYFRLSKDKSTQNKKVRGLKITDYQGGRCLATLEDVTITPLKDRGFDEILGEMWDSKPSNCYISCGQLLSVSTFHSWVITEGIMGITCEFIERWR